MIAKFLGVLVAGLMLVGAGVERAEAQMPVCYAIDEAISTLEADGWVAMDYRDSQLGPGVVEVLYVRGEDVMIAAIWPQGCIMPLAFGKLDLGEPA